MQADRDVRRRIEYRRDFMRLLALSLAGLCLALFVFATGEVEGTLALAAWAMLAAGCAGLAWAAGRTVFRGRPLLALSPDGIVWNFGNGEVAVPWSEVQGVETVTFTATGRSYRGTYSQRLADTTMVLVSREFYDRHIDPRSDFMRGPYWEWFYRPQGEVVQVALHHKMFGVSPREVRGPVEARWKAFREPGGQHPPQLARGAAPLRFGGGVQLHSPLQMAMVLVPLALCLALAGNIAGVWETPGQKNSRIQAEERVARDREINEQLDRHRQAQERMWQRLEEQNWMFGGPRRP